MPALRDDVDPTGLLEYSVVFTDRSLNHMSDEFRLVMRDIHAGLCDIYGAERTVIVPGGGTYAMEAVARQFASGARVLVIRNGLFSYRWSQIFAAGSIPAFETVMSAARTKNGAHAPFAPPLIEDVVACIRSQRPAIIFAPHVETASGIILPDDYICALAQAAHEVGGLFVLDCIASGCVWVDMKRTGVDVLISAPQKGWSAPPSAGLVMLSEAALRWCRKTRSTSFAADLSKWCAIMESYLDGGFAYHATMPTDALRVFRDALLETKSMGFAQMCAAQWLQGNAVRSILGRYGFQSVAANGFEAPGVVVCFTDDPEMQSGRAFAQAGIQIAAGVPLMLNEGDQFRSFRLGLFGIDKLRDVTASVQRLERAFNRIFASLPPVQ